MLVTLNVVEVAPSGTVTTPGMVSAVVSLFVIVNRAPPVGARSVRLIVPVAFCEPPTRFPGITVREKFSGLTVKVAVRLTYPALLAVRVTT